MYFTPGSIFRQYTVRILALIVLAFAGLFTYLFFSNFLVLTSDRPPLSVEEIHKRYVFYQSPINRRKVALTFDDGPTEHTMPIAKKLVALNIPATFFFVGSSAIQQPWIAREVQRMGFTIGNHSYSHRTNVHWSKEVMRRELLSTEYILETLLGVPTVYYRPPFLLSIGSDVTLNPYIVAPESALWIPELGFVPLGADIDSKDWYATSTDAIIHTVVSSLHKSEGRGGVVLLHDRYMTSQSVGELSRKVKEEGYRIVSLDEMLTPPITFFFSKDLSLGSTDSDVAYLQWFLFDKGYLPVWGLTGVHDMATVDAIARFEVDTHLAGNTSIQYASGRFSGDTRTAFNVLLNEKTFAANVSLIAASGVFAASFMQNLEFGYLYALSGLILIISWVIVASAGLMALKLAVVVPIHLFRLFRGVHSVVSPAVSAKRRKASVLVPAYNEEDCIGSMLTSLIAQKGVDLEVIVIDDGSKDHTARTVERIQAEPGGHIISLIRINNVGKPSALNTGLRVASHDLIVTVDADTILAPDAIVNLLTAFEDERTGAVAGKVYTTGEETVYDIMQSTEYAIGQNVDKKALSFLNAVHVVPGPIGAWRSNVLNEIGGFQIGTVVEDQDTTLAVLKAGYRVAYVESAHAFAETPYTLGDFLRQRYRWTYGTLQCFWKYKWAVLTLPYTGIGWVIIPAMFLYGVILPLSYVVVDAALVLGIVSGAWMTLVIPVIIFMLFDTVYSGIGTYGERNWLRLTLSVPVTRFLTRYIAFYVLVQGLVTASEGNAVLWNKVRRTGDLRRLFTSMLGHAAHEANK